MQKIILGIDEVGRGPYAGPLVIGACILPSPHEDFPWIEDLNDSKKLTQKKREKLYETIKKEAAASATGWVTSTELDEIGMSEALKLATRRAVEEIQKQNAPFSEIIIDGITNFLKGTKLESYATTMKKADFLIKEVSAASIVAKVERDNYMLELAKKYPEYGFEKHVGYGTAFHQKAMEEFGLTPEHRRSFAPVKKIDVVKNTTKKGNIGEEKVANFLIKSGHKIVARNYKTKYSEIDIISEKENVFYFTEVKYRKNEDFGGGIAAIDKKKLTRMKNAAEMFMKNKACDFKLAVGIVEGSQYELKDWFILDE